MELLAVEEADNVQPADDSDDNELAGDSQSYLSLPSNEHPVAR